MQPSARQQELERLYNSRRGHAPHISISDESHHVTEAIGSYYEEQDIPRKDPRPLSYLPAAAESFETTRSSRRKGSIFDAQRLQPANAASDPATRYSSMQSPADGDGSPSAIRPSASLKRMDSTGTENGHGRPSSPALSRQNSSENTATQQFPLNDIDYESSPAAVAQELSNLQAIRRMSMNVDMADPDLPSFGAGFGPGSEGEDDASQLFWVPARLHPELAPKEFKTFVEDRVEKIRRRSGSEDSLSPESTLDRSSSAASNLRRKKSMLSHSIDTRGNYEDGAERLERKRSKGTSLEGQAAVASLLDLETLVNDPGQLIQRLSLDTTSDDSVDGTIPEDRPILPPVGQALKRSTRTAYRRGSIRKGEYLPLSRRVQQRSADEHSSTDRPWSGQSTEDSDYVESPTTPSSPIAQRLVRVRTEPISSQHQQATSTSAEYEQPQMGTRRKKTLQTSRSSENIASQQSRTSHSRDRATAQVPQDTAYHEERTIEHPPRQSSHQQSPTPAPRPFQSRLASGPGRTTAQLPGYNNTNPLPNPLGDLIESLSEGGKGQQARSTQQHQQAHHERKSSQDSGRSGIQLSGPYLRLTPNKQNSSPSPSTLEDISASPSPFPGTGDHGRTDVLTVIPTFETSKRPEKKEGGRKSSWKWILGSDDDDKKAKEEKAAEAKSKVGKGVKQPVTDKTRLDVLQNSIDSGDNARGRESLVLNRSDFKLEDERKKEVRKAPEVRKERDKEPGLLQAIFGSKKKSFDGDSKEKKRKSDRNYSPESPVRTMRPDIDYNWTRFSILEERAIYRMAHIKLANPRRALHSQVLLSNFMYSYLAKVQMMHPHAQSSPVTQQQQQHSRSQSTKSSTREEQQPVEYGQYQQWQAQQSHEEETDHASAAEPTSKNGRRTSYEIMSGTPDDGHTHSNYSHTPHGEYGHDEEPQHHGSSAYDYGDEDDDDDYDQNYQSNASHAARANDAGGSMYDQSGGRGAYSVSSGQDYLGYAKDQSPFDQESLWDDGKHEDLW